MKPTPLIYIPDKQGGYNKATRKWHLADGTIVRKSAFSENPDPTSESFGFFSPNVMRTAPETEIRAKVERIVGGVEKGIDLTRDPVLRQAADNLNHLIAFVEPDVSANPIPGQIKAAYSLADYYCNTEGDVDQHITSPIDIALNPLAYQGDLADEMQDLYGVDRLGMNKVLSQILYSASKYGSAYPYEVYEGTEPKQIVLLPPKYMWVGYQVGSWNWNDTVGTGLQVATPYRLKPIDGSAEWSRELLDTSVKPIAYAPDGGDWNEQVPQGDSWGMKLPLEFLWPVRSKGMPYDRYTMPTISKAFHSIGSRTVFREMRRATIEGYRHQLWTFILGEKDKPPSPAEMAALRGTLNAMAGERTGYLAWRFGLEVKVVAPQVMDNLMTSETAMLFTLEIFRDLGVSAHLSTGNPVSLSAGGTAADLELDLSLWLRRLEAVRRDLLDWEFLFRLRYAKRTGGESKVKAMKKTYVTFSRSLLEIGELIKKELQPLYMTGAISVRTFLDRAGYNYDVELKNKKAELPDRELNMPMPTYNQTVENGKSSKTSPNGRPADNVNKSKIMAAWDNTALRDQYYADVEALVNLLVTDSDNSIDSSLFIDRLKEINENTLRAVTDQAYRSAGGVFEPTDHWLNIAANFVNSFADGFGQALRDHELTDTEIRSRAHLYPQEGYKMAMLNGQALAMKERGATEWQRIAHVTACADCKADALIMHAITEPFIVMHPNENCFNADMHVRYFSGTRDVLMEVPIPSANDDNQEIVQAQLGPAKSRTRRTRR